MLFPSLFIGHRRNKCRLLLITLWLCCALNVNGQYGQLLHKTFAERAALLNRFYSTDVLSLDSVTLLARINGVKKLALDNNDDDLLMEAALMRVQFICYRKLPHAFVLSTIDSVNREAKKQGILWLQLMTEDMLATYNFNRLQHYEQAFEHAQRVYDLMKNISPAVFPFKSNFLSQMAEMHYFFSDYRQAIFYNLQAVRAEVSTPVEGFPIGINTLNTIGLCYQQLNMNDSAEYYFRSTISLAKKRKDEAWDGIGNGNVGYILFLKKKYTEASPLLQKDVRIAVKRADWPLASGSLMALANISLLNGNLTAAGKQIDSCRLYVNRSGQYQRFQRLYPLMSKYYALTNRPALAAEYLDSSTFVKDSLNRKFSALVMLRASQKIDLERNRAAIANIEAQKAINILERDSLAGILFLLIAITFLLYNRQKIIVKRNEAALQLEKAEARQERDAARLALVDYTDKLRQQNDLVESFKAEMDNTQREADPLYQLRVAELEQLMKAHIMTDKAWKEFKNLFDKVHPHFFTVVNNRFQNLTDTDIRLLALIKLRLSNPEMAGMLGISVEGVRKSKQRLRKRAAIPEENSLEEAVAAI
jgi:hypothetical protein